MTILGFFTEPGPSELEIMGEMINDQTRVIGNMINDQTEVLLAAASAILGAKYLFFVSSCFEGTRELNFAQCA